MTGPWTLKYWKRLVKKDPDIGNAVWHDPKSGWGEAKQHNTWLQMVILMTGILSRNDQEQIQVIHLLLEHGADPNKKNDFGQSALHFVCGHEYRDPEIAKLLLDYGADPNSLNIKGKSSLDLLGTGPESEEIRQHLEKTRKDLPR